jgi:pimeloyl-ACP methyl ester carboxylesterase
MAAEEVARYPGRDGADLAYREVGDGRPLVLLHGFLTTGSLWLDHGPATVFARHGYRVILPDLRGHGDSAHPHDPAAYPPDVLADDGLALIDHLGLDDYDLGGYSLGARAVLRMLARGARPTHAIVAGQGLDAVARATSRTSMYHRVLTALAEQTAVDPEDEDIAQWITGDPLALRLVLDTHVPTSPEALRQLPTPTLVAIGDQDDGHSSADLLADALPNARFVRVPGNHFTAFTSPEFAKVTLEFLSRPLG